MSVSNFEKYALTFLSGAAVGAALGILFAPDKGSVTRKKIATKAKTVSSDVNEKIAELRHRTEELLAELKDVANVLSNDPLEEEEEEA